MTDHFADTFVRENVAPNILRCGELITFESLRLTPFCFEKTSVRKWIFNVTDSDVSLIRHRNNITLPHILIKEKLTELIEQTFNRDGSLYLACNDKNAFYTSEQPKRYKLLSCQKLCDTLYYLLDNVFIRFGSKLYRHIVGIPMGADCAPLVADLFLFCYERDSILSLSDNNQTDVIEAFNSTSRYLDDLLNIDNPYFD